MLKYVNQILIYIYTPEYLVTFKVLRLNKAILTRNKIQLYNEKINSYNMFIYYLICLR